MAQFGAVGLIALALAPVPGRAEPVPALPRGDLIGATGVYQVRAGETFVHIARRADLGFVELRAANAGIDPWLPPEGVELTLPLAHLLPEAPRRGIVINLAELRLYSFDGAGAVVSFPIGIGSSGWETPLGQTRVVGKRTRPTWTAPASIRAERPHLPAVMAPGPDNPLGDYALDLALPGYLMHGTNRPDGVGRRVSHGCIRLYPEDIAWLFPRVAVGTPVTIVDQPVKAGWSGGRFYVEVHPTQAQADAIEARGAFAAEPATDLDWRVQSAAGAATGRLDWPLIRTIAADRRGVPMVVGPRAVPPGDTLGARPLPYLRSD